MNRDEVPLSSFKTAQVNALPIKRCTHKDGINIRYKEMKKILKVGVVPSIFCVIPMSSVSIVGR